jgi:hypothetical protein
MRILNQTLESAGDMTLTLNSQPLNLEFAFGYAIQADISGSPVGTIKLQGSNDAPPDAYPQFASFAPTNWTDITGSSTAITGAGSVLFNAASIYFRWVRSVYTPASGSGSLTIVGNTKGF